MDLRLYAYILAGWILSGLAAVYLNLESRQRIIFSMIGGIGMPLTMFILGLVLSAIRGRIKGSR